MNRSDDGRMTIAAGQLAMRSLASTREFAFCQATTLLHALFFRLLACVCRCSFILNVPNCTVALHVDRCRTNRYALLIAECPPLRDHTDKVQSPFCLVNFATNVQQRNVLSCDNIGLTGKFYDIIVMQYQHKNIILG